MMITVGKVSGGEVQATPRVRVNVRLPSGLAEAMRTAAREDGMGQSAWVARAVSHELERRSELH